MNMAAPDVTARIEKMIHDDEGGWKFTDRADDSGGPTYGGMTWRKFNEWQQKLPKDHRVAKAEFVKLAKDGELDLKNAIRQCYYDEFWLKGHVSEVPEFARQMYLSACVNMGLKEALKCLQLAFNNQTEIVTGLKLTVDGHWGPQTARALNWFTEKSKEFEQYQYLAQDAFKLAFSDAVMHRYIRIVQANAREWREFAREAKRAQDENFVPHHIKLPRVLQTENLMGWFNRAVGYRNK